MNIGIRLHDVAGQGLEDRLDTARAQGFGSVHLALQKVLGAQMTHPENLTAALAERVRGALQARDMRLAVLGCYLNLAHPNGEELKRIQARYLAHLELLKALGEGVLGTETGAPNAAYAYEPACHTKAALTAFLKGLEPIVRRAEELDVLVAIEPVYKHIVFDAKTAREALDAMRSPALKIILDPVNLLTIDSAPRYMDVLKQARDLLLSDIAALHIKGFRLENGEVKAVAAGEGGVDWARILPDFAREKPTMCATLENTTIENAARACAYVKQCIQ